MTMGISAVPVTVVSGDGNDDGGKRFLLNNNHTGRHVTITSSSSSSTRSKKKKGRRARVHFLIKLLFVIGWIYIFLSFRRQYHLFHTANITTTTTTTKISSSFNNDNNAKGQRHDEKENLLFALPPPNNKRKRKEEERDRTIGSNQVVASHSSMQQQNAPPPEQPIIGSQQVVVTSPLNNNNYTKYNTNIRWTCRTETNNEKVEDESTTSKGTDTFFRPLVIFATERTGSNLLFNMIHGIYTTTTSNDNKTSASLSSSSLYVEELYELFSDVPSVLERNKVRISKQLRKNCNTGSSHHHQLWNRKYSTQIASHAIQNRVQNVSGLLQLLTGIPSSKGTSGSKNKNRNNNSWFVFKIFPFQLQRSSTSTPKEFIETILNLTSSSTTTTTTQEEEERTTNSKNRKMNSPKFIILWRQRHIESYVSFQIAKQSKLWKNSNTNNQTIYVNKTQLETFITKLNHYYTSIQNELLNHSSSSNLEYEKDVEIFEYQHDLAESESHKKTIQRLGKMLLDTNTDTDTETNEIRTILPLAQIKEIQNSIQLKKQATIPIQYQIQNWEEVVSWGYGGELSEWPNIFV